MESSPDPTSDDSSHVIWRISGEVDADNSDEFRAQLDGHAEKTSHLKLDLSGVTFIDSSGISELLRVSHALTGRGGELVISEASGPVKRVLEITGLLAHFGLD